QAEDGIRDGHVTGVQTCALPIYRFMFNIRVDYPTRAEEIQIMKTTTSNQKPDVEPVLDAKTILRLQETVRQVVVADHVFSYAAEIGRASCRERVSSAGGAGAL